MASKDDPTQVFVNEPSETRTSDGVTTPPTSLTRVISPIFMLNSTPPPPPYTINGSPSPMYNFKDITATPSQPTDAYDTTLPHWRAAIRRRLLQNVELETPVLAWMQERVRTPWLDKYFLYTSALGTHTFFMTFLPALFFFGYAEIGRGLLVVLALGVYCSSFVKDLICSPRPFAPPVTRLTMGTHHLEYGFPSTHSTNSVSIALFFFTHLHRLASSSAHEPEPVVSATAYALLTAALVWYALSIVFGRLYTAMHSFTDCAVGVLMGAGIWWVHDGYWGLGAGAWVEGLVEGYGVSVPLILIPICLIMVNQHPQPVDDCPCFEDAIAFVSVVMGSLLARWHATHYGFDEPFFTSIMPGSAAETQGDVGVWCFFATVKMVVGILIIFSWRILAKSTLHLILPPTFRLLSQAFTLPNRRFYTPATDYGSVPSELGLQPIPSVIDLPGELRFGEEEGEASGVRRGERRVKLRGGAVGGRDEKSIRARTWELEKNGGGNGEGAKDVKHYDADVLTKVIVYCGIAVLACEVLPVMFEVLGWGVKSWN